MLRRRPRSTALGGALLVTGLLAVPALPAGAEIQGPVDIRVELDLPYDGSDGPAVFEVTGVTPGPGPELSSADLTDNPSNWCGSLVVDIDPDTSLVTITPDEPCDFERATVTITAAGVTGLFTVQDTLWQEEDPPMSLVEAAAAAPGIVIVWDNGGVDNSIDMAQDGAAVFRYFTGTLAVAPASVAAGETATVSGDECATGTVEVSVPGRPAQGVTPAADGMWSVEVDTTGLPEGPLTVSATCVFGDTGFDYPTATLTIAAPASTTAAPTPTTAAPTAPPAATPARPVTAQPRFTG